MGRFLIGFTSGTLLYEHGTPMMRGEIQLGDFREAFLATIGSWTREAYEQAWRNAARQLVQGAEVSAFVADASDGPTWNVWIAVVNGERVSFYNAMLPRTEFSNSNDVWALAGSVQEQFKEPGDKWSRWRLEVRDMAAFANP